MSRPTMMERISYRISILERRYQYHRYCIEAELKSVANYKSRELRDFLKPRGVWVQKDRTISIAKALANTVQKWTEWPATEPFGSSTISCNASATSSPAFPPEAESSMQKPLDRPQQLVRPQIFIQRAISLVPIAKIQRIAPVAPVAPVQQHQSAESTDQSDGPDQISYEVKNGSEDTPYQPPNEIALAKVISHINTHSK